MDIVHDLSVISSYICELYSNDDFGLNSLPLNL